MTGDIPKKILMIDDKLENIGPFYSFLEQKKFRVLVASGGEQGIRIASQSEASVDLILLDITMPRMDGYETCRRLKSDTRTASIPVVFMTARHDTEDKIKGLRMGAIDYVTKPIQHEEALARINTHLEVHELRKQLEEHVEALEQKNEELAIANAELDAFAGTVAHDLKTPLSSLIVALEMIKELAGNNQDILQYTEYIEQGGRQMAGITDALLLLARVSRQKVPLEPIDMEQVVGNVRLSLRGLLKRHNTNVDSIKFSNSWPVAFGYGPWVEEIWRNYLSNAFKYGGKPPMVEIGASEQGEYIQFWVQDNGEGLSEDEQAKLFIPFNRLQRKQREQGHGLGLSIVQRIAERLNGDVGVESHPGQGSRFYFTLPAYEPDNHAD